MGLRLLNIVWIIFQGGGVDGSQVTELGARATLLGNNVFYSKLLLQALKPFPLRYSIKTIQIEANRGPIQRLEVAVRVRGSISDWVVIYYSIWGLY